MEAANRRPKEKKPVLAICYDFDKTLSPNDMQAQGYIQAVYDGDVPSFWKESNEMAEKNEMDTNLAYMYKMVKEAHGKIVLTRKSLEDYGAKVKLFDGVEEWFSRISTYGKENGVIVEHYIISSGLKEMIEGTSVGKAGVFEKIYASSFMFDDKDVPIWPAQVVNFTNKTQFLFRIEKGILDVNDSGVNDSFSPEELRVPFRNMVYIGDSDTDIPCMKLVNTYGGHSIGVYNEDTLDKSKVYKMLNDNRIKYFAPADYSEGSKLDKLVKAIIARTAANEALENIHYLCKSEYENDNKEGQSIRARNSKLSLIISLDGSKNFATTHAIIKKLSDVKTWNEKERDMLVNIALRNRQVRYIINDKDVKNFYETLLDGVDSSSEKIEELKSLFD